MEKSHQSIHHTTKIPLENRGLRVDQSLAQLFPEYSRAKLTQWLKTGHILIDNKILKPKDKVQGGEEIIIEAQLENQSELLPEDIPIDIVFEDGELVIINKQANLTVHPGAGNPSGTLLNALLHHCPDLNKLPRAGLIHRIDKDTTGLLVVAKTLSAHTHLVNQLQLREFEREYGAICNGVLISGDTINKPIGRDPHNRIKMAVVHNGKPAVTHYRIIEKFENHTHLKINLETGRTHQIRVHMQSIKHPLVGDPVYGGRFKKPMGFNRQALHAKKIGFIHPKNNKKIVFECDYPEDMKKLLEYLKNDNT